MIATTRVRIYNSIPNPTDSGILRTDPKRNDRYHEPIDILPSANAILLTRVLPRFVKLSDCIRG
jgi:hypothetical protein